MVNRTQPVRGKRRKVSRSTRTYSSLGSGVAGAIRGEAAMDFPTVEDGAIGVHFIHAAVRSGREGRWVDTAYTPGGGAP